MPPSASTATIPSHMQRFPLPCPCPCPRSRSHACLPIPAPPIPHVCPLLRILPHPPWLNAHLHLHLHEIGDLLLAAPVLDAIHLVRQAAQHLAAANLPVLHLAHVLAQGGDVGLAGAAGGRSKARRGAVGRARLGWYSGVLLWRWDCDLPLFLSLFPSCPVPPHYPTITLVSSPVQPVVEAVVLGRRHLVPDHLIQAGLAEALVALVLLGWE